MTDTATTDDVGGIAGAQLRSIVERVERLEEEKKGLQDDIKEIMAEAKGNGFEPKVVRKVISLRKKSKEDRQEEEMLLDLYKQALGME
ncbi:MAG: DUF2312 domain-containing protein [Rhodospirillaceae bacterium]